VNHRGIAGSSSITQHSFSLIGIYAIIVVRLKSAEEVEKEELTEEEQLARADVATLSRAQRRARARMIMKQQRRIAPAAQQQGEEGAEDNQIVAVQAEEPEASGQTHLSRKERQKAAKAAEKEERRLFEEERRRQQQEEEDAARKGKRERERLEALKTEEEKRLQKARQEAQEQEELKAWRTFLSSPERTQTVNDWVAEVKAKRSIQVDETAAFFDLSPDKVLASIRELIKEGRVAGVITRDGRFIYFSDEELASVANEVRSSGTITLTQIAKTCQGIINNVEGN